MKDFIYPHLLASYAACNRSKQSNRVHIIFWETTNANGVENIWQYTSCSDHALEWSHRIRILCPDVSIKWCKDSVDNLDKYVEQHPDEYFIISCANDSWWWDSRQRFNNSSVIASLEKLLKHKNIIIIYSVGNRLSPKWKVYNENVKDWDMYTSASKNSKLKNKISVVWHDTQSSNNYFCPSNGQYLWLSSAMPVKFEKDEWNLLMPMFWLIRSDGSIDYDTTSSYPAGVTSGVVWNAVSVVISNHLGITAEDAMAIIEDNYLTEEKFQYKDDPINWELVDWWYWYSIDMQKLLKNELLQSDKMNKLQFNKDEVELPSGPWICHIGEWVQFEYEWKRYSNTSANQSILKQALKSWNIKFFWNKDLHKKQGWGNSVKIDVYVVNKNGDKFPDLHLSVTKNIN